MDPRQPREHERREGKHAASVLPLIRVLIWRTQDEETRRPLRAYTHLKEGDHAHATLAEGGLDTLVIERAVDHGGDGSLRVTLVAHACSLAFPKKAGPLREPSGLRTDEISRRSSTHLPKIRIRAAQLWQKRYTHLQ